MNVLVYGGSGQLGRAIVSRFLTANFKVTSIDFKENADATQNIILESRNESLEAMGSRIIASLNNSSFDAVINVAGGWAGGNAASDGIFSSSRLS